PPLSPTHWGPELASMGGLWGWGVTGHFPLLLRDRNQALGLGAEPHQVGPHLGHSQAGLTRLVREPTPFGSRTAGGPAHFAKFCPGWQSRSRAGKEITTITYGAGEGRLCQLAGGFTPPFGPARRPLRNPESQGETDLPPGAQNPLLGPSPPAIVISPGTGG